MRETRSKWTPRRTPFQKRPRGVSCQNPYLFRELTVGIAQVSTWFTQRHGDFFPVALDIDATSWIFEIVFCELFVGIAQVSTWFTQGHGDFLPVALDISATSWIFEVVSCELLVGAASLHTAELVDIAISSCELLDLALILCQCKKYRLTRIVCQFWHSTKPVTCGNSDFLVLDLYISTTVPIEKYTTLVKFSILFLGKIYMWESAFFRH